MRPSRSDLTFFRGGDPPQKNIEFKDLEKCNLHFPRSTPPPKNVNYISGGPPPFLMTKGVVIVQYIISQRKAHDAIPFYKNVIMIDNDLQPRFGTKTWQESLIPARALSSSARSFARATRSSSLCKDGIFNDRRTALCSVGVFSQRQGAKGIKSIKDQRDSCLPQQKIEIRAMPRRIEWVEGSHANTILGKQTGRSYRLEFRQYQTIHNLIW